LIDASQGGIYPVNIPSAVTITQQDMAFLNTEDLVPGMVLAESVYDGRGRLLMPAGIELARDHQRQLRRRGVVIVAVVRDSIPRTTAFVDPAMVKNAAQPVIAPTALPRAEPFMIELARLARERYDRQHGQ
jgi:hypothetical protein